MLAALTVNSGIAMRQNAAIKVFKKAAFDFFAERSSVLTEQVTPVPLIRCCDFAY